MEAEALKDFMEFMLEWFIHLMSALIAVLVGFGFKALKDLLLTVVDMKVILAENHKDAVLHRQLLEDHEEKLEDHEEKLNRHHTRISLLESNKFTKEEIKKLREKFDSFRGN